MIPVTRPFAATTCCLLALCLASAAAHASEPTEEPAPAASADPLDGVDEPVTSPEHAAVASAPPSDLQASAPLAGAIGAAVGVSTGAVVGIGGSYLIQALTVGAPTSGMVSGVAVLANLVAPLMYFGLPLLGAGLGAFVALAQVTDVPTAAIGGVAAAVATPVGAVAGGVAGVAGGAAVAFVITGGGGDGWAMIGLGVLGGMVGAGLGAIAGAASGGAAAGLVAASLE